MLMLNFLFVKSFPTWSLCNFYILIKITLKLKCCRLLFINYIHKPYYINLHLLKNLINNNLKYCDGKLVKEELNQMVYIICQILSNTACNSALKLYFRGRPAYFLVSGADNVAICDLYAIETRIFTICCEIF